MQGQARGARRPWSPKCGPSLRAAPSGGPVRTDAGLFTGAILEALEQARLPYAIAARFTTPLRAGIGQPTLPPFAPGLHGPAFRP